jgi:4-amino-4-deoxy-L-arabinose transferase-like glycosyltransferase
MLLAILAAASLRAWGISDRGLWIDEYGTWWTIAGETWGDCWRRALEIQGQSPLYYLTVRLSVELFGISALSLRLPSLLFGIALLALSYPLALRLFRDRRIAILTVLAAALNERLIYYSQEARPYAMGLLCVGASFYFYAALLDRGSFGARLGHVITTVATYYTHYLFGVVLLVQLLHLAAQRPWRWARWRPWIATMALLGPMMVPGLWQLRAIFARRQGLDWIPLGSGPLVILQPAMDLVDAPLLGAVSAAALLAWVWRREGRLALREAHPGLVVLWLAVPFLLFSVLPRLFGINLLHALLVVLAPAVPITYGALMGLPRNGALRASLPLVVFLCLSLGLRVVPWLRGEGAFSWFFQHGWEVAVKMLVRMHREGDLILYRTGFVELDDAVRGEASPATTGVHRVAHPGAPPVNWEFGLRRFPIATARDEDAHRLHLARRRRRVGGGWWASSSTIRRGRGPSSIGC